MAKKEYKRDKLEVMDSVESLKGNIESILDNIDEPIDSYFPSENLLPNIDVDYQRHDYEKDIELVKIESRATLESLANLYLTEEIMKNKNIYKIIKDDSEALTNLNFSISVAKRALISCMNQIDMGVVDPLMYQSITMFQKEMRDTIKMMYELQKKMKEFYKELKTELAEINSGEEIKPTNDDNITIIGDPKQLNDIFEQWMKNPEILKNSQK